MLIFSRFRIFTSLFALNFTFIIIIVPIWYFNLRIICFWSFLYFWRILPISWWYARGSGHRFVIIVFVLRIFIWMSTIRIWFAANAIFTLGKLDTIKAEPFVNYFYHILSLAAVANSTINIVNLYLLFNLISLVLPFQVILQHLSLQIVIIVCRFISSRFR